MRRYSDCWALMWRHSSASRRTSTAPTSTLSSVRRSSAPALQFRCHGVSALTRDRAQAWDAFYILATELALKAKGFEFETYVNNFMKDVVFPAFCSYLDSCQDAKAKLTTKRECVKKIVSFDFNITPGADISYLTQLLPSVIK
jgi:hypothetical protein